MLDVLSSSAETLQAHTGQRTNGGRFGVGGAAVLPCHADLRGELMYGIVAAWRASGELLHSTTTATLLNCTSTELLQLCYYCTTTNYNCTTTIAALLNWRARPKISHLAAGRHIQLVY